MSSYFRLFPTFIIIFYLSACASIDLESEEEYRATGAATGAQPVERGAYYEAYEAPSRRRVPASDEEYARIRLERAYANRDLILGMDMSDVRHLWGEPSEVHVAGESHMGNQRWVYFQGLSSPWSMRESRVIYFEDGRVAGWSTQ